MGVTEEEIEEQVLEQIAILEAKKAELKAKLNTQIEELTAKLGLPILIHKLSALE